MAGPLLPFALAAALAGLAAASPTLGPMFGDHMVVQHGRPVPVWGWADAGEEISVTLGPSGARTVAGADGRWRVDLAPQKPGGPLTLVVAGKSTLRFRDVLAGEVWVASGQSNMHYPLGSATTAAEDLASAADTELRLFTVPRASALAPQQTFTAAWRIAAADSARPFSAVAWHFARKLRRALKMPVGIIQTSWSGSIAEEWTDPESLRADPDFAPILDRWRDAEPRESGYLGKPFEFDLRIEGIQLLPRAGSAPVWLADFRSGAFRSETGGDWRYGWESAPQTGFEVAPEAGAYAARLSGNLYSPEGVQLALTCKPGGAPADLREYSAIRFRHRGKGVFACRWPPGAAATPPASWKRRRSGPKRPWRSRICAPAGPAAGSRSTPVRSRVWP